jgi:hypothetical protein
MRQKSVHPESSSERIVQLALDEPELSPRELATRFTGTANYFVSEASVYRLLKAHDLITSPAYIIMKAADEFKDKTTAPLTFLLITAGDGDFAGLVRSRGDRATKSDHATAGDCRFTQTLMESR